VERKKERFLTSSTAGNPVKIPDDTHQYCKNLDAAQHYCRKSAAQWHTSSVPKRASELVSEQHLSFECSCP
jgi:hypothetical protein